MERVIQDIEVKKTKVKYEFSDIEDTEFVRWWATRIITKNDEIIEENKFCGVCPKIVFNSLSNCEFPSSDVDFQFLSNSHWTVKAIRKDDMNDVMEGKKDIDSVIKDIYFDNINSDEYDLYLYGIYFSQLLTLDKKLVNYPIKIKVGENTASRVLHNWWDVVRYVQNLETNRETDKYNVIRVLDIPNQNQIELFVQIPLHLRIQYESLDNIFNRLEFFLTDLWNIPRKHIPRKDNIE